MLRDNQQDEDNESIAVMVAMEPEMKKICQPFMDDFNLASISLIRAYWNMRCVSLSTHGESFQYYHDAELWRHSKGNVPDGWDLVKYNDNADESSPYYQKIVKVLEDKFDISHTITVIIFHIGYIDAVSFSVPKAMTDFINIFKRNIDVFEEFMTYLRQAVRPLLKSLKNHRLPLKLPDNPDPGSFLVGLMAVGCFGITDKIRCHYDKYLRKKPKKKYLPKKYYLEEPFNDVYFTMREVQVLKLIMQSFSFKQIAARLGLTSHTVRDYSDNIRHKLSCESKSELIEKVCKYSIDIMLKDTIHTDSILANFGRESANECSGFEVIFNRFIEYFSQNKPKENQFKEIRPILAKLGFRLDDEVQSAAESQGMSDQVCQQQEEA
ncbi:MAG: helix-turn-helix transcriptional regulator [Gammaproteobacteria bacterium]|nr:helix-turn-helix transcriptional regulator [Gammaproteobacteria bacterium]